MRLTFNDVSLFFSQIKTRIINFFKRFFPDSHGLNKYKSHESMQRLFAIAPYLTEHINLNENIAGKTDKKIDPFKYEDAIFMLGLNAHEPLAKDAFSERFVKLFNAWDMRAQAISTSVLMTHFKRLAQKNVIAAITICEHHGWSINDTMVLPVERQRSKQNALKTNAATPHTEQCLKKPFADIISFAYIKYEGTQYSSHQYPEGPQKLLKYK